MCSWPGPVECRFSRGMGTVNGPVNKSLLGPSNPHAALIVMGLAGATGLASWVTENCSKRMTKAQRGPHGMYMCVGHACAKCETTINRLIAVAQIKHQVFLWSGERIAKANARS
jgi:hypothetical protein